jgi:hypothetical protein
LHPASESSTEYALATGPICREGTEFGSVDCAKPGFLTVLTCHEQKDITEACTESSKD